jgi:hypothetical protein
MDVKVGEQREVKAPQIRRFIVETVLGDKRMGTSF